MTASDLTGQEVDALGVRPSLRVRVPEHVVYREFPEQSVVLNLEKGHYHGLNRSGSVAFALLASGETLATVAQALSTRYRLSSAHAQRDVSRLCASLLERGLLERADPD
jgi:coenzyme PQQ synthesis protein D (PqqD)